MSIDGKAIKNARDSINGGNTLYVVSAFLSDIGISVVQVKVDDKSNEITAIPELINLLDIQGKIITIDAIGTQKNICNLITSNDKKGNFILKVKDNQKDHSRFEKRTYYLSYDVSIISDKSKWKSVKAIDRIDVKRIESNKEKSY